MGEKLSKILKDGVELGFKSGDVTNGQYIATVFKEVPYNQLKEIYQNSASLQGVFDKHDLDFPKNSNYVNFFLSELTEEQSNEIATAFKNSQ